MNAKNTILSLLAAAAVCTAPALAMADGHGHPERCPRPHRAAPCERPVPPMPGMNAEQMAQMKQFRQEHHSAIAPLRDQLAQKRMELHALSPNPNVKPEELKAIVSDIMSLRRQMHAVDEAFREKMEKAGLPFCGQRDSRGHRSFHGWKKDCGPHGMHRDCPALR